MKLAHSEKKETFFVTFTDLLFTTLIIFILLVMAMAFEMSQATQTAKDNSAQAIEDSKKAKEEAEKAKAEAQKLKDEAEKAKQELDKSKAEAEKILADAAKAKSEAKAAKVEAEKTKSEIGGLKQAISRLVATNRFTGGSDRTTWYYAPMQIGGKTHVFFLPIQLEEVMGFVRSENDTDPVLMLCRMALQAAPETDGMLIMSADDLIGLQGGVSLEFAGASVHTSEGWYLAAIRAAQERDPAGTAMMSPQQLRDRIGGYKIKAIADLPADLQPAVNAYLNWLYGPNNINGFRSGETVGALKRAIADTKGQPPYIRFSTTNDRKIRVGRTVLTQGQFRNLLRAIKPGRGFFIEYLTAEGKVEEPPEWVFREILDVVGFNNHIVNESAMRGRP